MKRLGGVALLATVIVFGLSCGGEPMMSGPGTLLVRLTSPHSGADSAIVLTITGPAAKLYPTVLPPPGLDANPIRPPAFVSKACAALTDETE